MKRFIAIAATAICCMGNEMPANARVKTTEDVMTGVSRHVLTIDSNTTVANSIGIQKTATIIIRCKGTELDAYVHTPTYNGIFYRSNPVVSTRWDGGKITSGSWGASKDGDAMFHPRPASFIGELAAAKTFVFGWQPYSTQRVAARWNLQHHKADIQKISRLCGVNISAKSNSGVTPAQRQAQSEFRNFYQAEYKPTSFVSKDVCSAYGDLCQTIGL